MCCRIVNYIAINCLNCCGCRTAANGSPGGNDSPGGGDRKRMRRSYQPKTLKVELTYAAKIPMSAIGQVIRGEESENSLEALRVLDIILRQHAAKQYVPTYLSDDCT